MIQKISPIHSSHDFQNASDFKKVDIYFSQLHGWYLDWAKRLNRNDLQEHSGFAVLYLVMGFFESRGGLFYDEKQPHVLFRKGFILIFNEEKNALSITDHAIDKLYGKARCGFYHNLAARKGIILKDNINERYPFILKGDNWFFNKYRFVDKIINRVKELQVEIKKDPELIESVMKRMNE